MGISRLTAIAIQERDDLIITHSGPSDGGKYKGFIALPADQYCRPLVSTEPMFDSADAAELHMRNLMSRIQEMDIYSAQKH